MLEDEVNLFAERFYPGHPLGRPIQGTESTVGALSRSRLLRFFREVYLPKNLLIVAAGNLRHESIAKRVRRTFGGMPAVRLHLAVEGESGRISWVHVAIAADDRIYSMTATSADSDFAWADATLSTFRFLRPPARRDAAWRVGYAFGKYVLGPGLVAGLVAGIVLLVRRLARGRSA